MHVTVGATVSLPAPVVMHPVSARLLRINNDVVFWFNDVIPAKVTLSAIVVVVAPHDLALVEVGVDELLLETSTR
jgi:hypothetical protein